VQSDGTLKEMHGDIYAPRRPAKFVGAEAKWEKCYWRAKNSSNQMTFFMAESLFAKENYGQWPSRTWRMMPMNPDDMVRPVWNVPNERLRL
jgi:hypothetical protein